MQTYEEIKCIGRGSYGSAHLVVERTSGERFVIKKIPMELLTDHEKQQSFREVELLSKLKHPNVVEYKESFVEGNVIHIVMAYCDGGDLAGRIKERAAEVARDGEHGYFSTAQILDWFVQMAMAIKYLHEQRILHRDLKTSNIFLTTQNVIKLGDFGIAKTLDSTLDQAKTVVGTPYYMSPEVCESKPYSYASDVWSLGCVLYEMIALKHAFDAPNILTLILKIVQNDFAAIPPHYDPEMSIILKKLLDKRPENRPTMDQIFMMPFIRTHMQGFVQSGGSLKLAPTMARRPHGTPKRRVPGKNGRRASNEIGRRRIQMPLSKEAEWAPVAPQNGELGLDGDSDLALLDVSTSADDQNIAVRLPERSVTPEPLLGSPTDEPKAVQLASPSRHFGAEQLPLPPRKQPASAWQAQSTAFAARRLSNEEVEEEIDLRFQTEAEELMNPNFQSEYSEECMDSLQIYYGSQVKPRGRRGIPRIRAVGRPSRSASSPSKYEPPGRAREMQDDVIVEHFQHVLRKPDGRPDHHSDGDAYVGGTHRRLGQVTKDVLSLSIDESVFDPDNGDGAGDTASLSESGILRELEMDAESSGDENGDAYTSNSEYEGEENFYSEHSGYSDDSDFIEGNEAEYSDDFEDPDAEIIEYANDEFQPEDADALANWRSGGGVVPTPVGHLTMTGIRSPKFASSPASRRPPTEAQWVMQNVAQSLMASCDNLSVS